MRARARSAVKVLDRPRDPEDTDGSGDTAANSTQLQTTQLCQGREQGQQPTMVQWSRMSRERTKRVRAKPSGNLTAIHSFLPVLPNTRFPLSFKSKPSLTLPCTKNKKVYISHLLHWARSRVTTETVYLTEWASSYSFSIL